MCPFNNPDACCGLYYSRSGTTTRKQSMLLPPLGTTRVYFPFLRLLQPCNQLQSETVSRTVLLGIASGHIKTNTHMQSHGA